MEALTIKLFEPIKERFIKLANEETFIKEASFAMQALSKNSYLSSMDKNSIIESVLNICQVGLTLNPISKFAYLIPRNGKCCLDVSYIGLVKLITDTGSVKNVYAHIIRDGDLFEQTLGTHPEINHKPKLGNKGEIIGAYAVAILKDGTKQVEVMDINEVNEIRDKSEAYKAYKAGKTKSCIWVDYPGEMDRKTVVKRICKYLPKSEKWEKIDQAIELDNQDFKASYMQLDRIDGLLRTSTISEEKKEFISRIMNTYSSEDANLVIQELQDKQIDLIDAGEMVNQTQIKDKLKFVK